jgi:hypothetical protein
VSESVAHYFDLSSVEQAELLHGVAPLLGRRAEILEKDIWLCQVLRILFALPNRKPMAFKGGTSLSKVYQAIERLSRHWYDLARLADHEVGQKALADTKLLADVLNIKETFYRSGFSHYGLCQAGGLRLIPDGVLMRALERDYQTMLDAQMFYGESLDFRRIMERLSALERDINRVASMQRT